MVTTRAIQTGTPRQDALTVERERLFLSGALLGAAFIVFAFASVFHPHEVDPNNHVLSFAQYAHASGWTADHLAFFAYWAIVIAGLLVLFYALNPTGDMQRLLVRFGTISAGVTLALSAMRFAIDGVVLKRAVDAWTAGPEAEQAARFAAAETVRWMEEAMISYQGFAFGLTLAVLAVLIVWTAQVPRPVGYVLGITGAAYLALGWIVGVAGLAPQGVIPSYVAEIAPLVVSLYLLITAWRMRSREIRDPLRVSDDGLNRARS